MHDLKCVTGNRKAEKVTTTLVLLLTNHVEIFEDDELLIWKPKEKKAGGRQSCVKKASTKAVAHEKAVKAGTKSKKVNKKR